MLKNPVDDANQLTHDQPETTEVDELKQQLATMEANWKRALADYHNFQKRVQQQRQTIAELACLDLIERLLPALDHLELAANHLSDAGLSMVVKQFEEAFAAQGMTPIEALHQPFDPQTMECVDQVPGPKNEVTTVVAKGYRIGDHIIRPAKVQVGNGDKN